MKLLRHTSLTLLAVLLAVFPTLVHAQNIARVYVLTPMPGKAVAFEQALKTHAAWRMQAGDPWTWSVFNIITGEHAGSYLVGSWGHKWADLDAYDAGFGAKGSARFDTDVGPLLASWTSWIQVGDTANARMPETDEGFNLVTFILYDVKPDKWRAFQAAVSAVDKALAKNNYPGHWAWFTRQDGGRGPVRGLAVFNKDWAGFQEPDPNALQLVTKEYGSDMTDHILQDFTGSYYSAELEMMRWRPDLSVRHPGR